MHMADALLAPAVAGTMYLCSSAAAGYSIHRVKKFQQPEKVPVMGVMGAFVFAAQMINFTIPGTGSSGHLCGGMLLSAVLGPEAGFLTMIGVLLIQCILFADGGLMALGANVWNMAFYSCFVGGYLIWRLMMKGGVSRTKITLASMLGCVLTLQLGAFSVTVETLFSGITELPFAAFVGFMQPIHLAIGLVEGLITAAVLVFIHEMRPELLWNCNRTEGTPGISQRKLVGILALAAVVTGGALSLFASSAPDGLEWSMEKLAGTSELEATGAAYEVSAAIQDTTSILPDYAFSGTDTAVGTSVSGIVGGAFVLVLCIGACYVLRLFRRKEADGQKE